MAVIFKDHNIMTIPDLAVFFSVVQQLWNDAYDTEVSVVTIGVREGILLGEAEKNCPEDNTLP